MANHEISQQWLHFVPNTIKPLTLIPFSTKVAAGVLEDQIKWMIFFSKLKLHILLIE